MASFFFDGNKRLIYEVPTNPNLVVDENGYRIYTPLGGGDNPSRLDIQKDLWSRFQDWYALNKWSTIAVSRAGGNFRGTDAQGNDLYQTNDFTIKTSLGWRIVLANYPHELILRGNLFSDDGSTLFDYSRITVDGVFPRISGFDSLLTYTVAGETGGGGGGGTGDATVVNQQNILAELARIQGPSFDTATDSLVKVIENIAALNAALSSNASQTSLDSAIEILQQLKKLRGLESGVLVTGKSPEDGTTGYLRTSDDEISITLTKNPDGSVTASL
jgi:hypothetical protein